MKFWAALQSDWGQNRPGFQIGGKIGSDLIFILHWGLGWSAFKSSWEKWSEDCEETYGNEWVVFSQIMSRLISWSSISSPSTSSTSSPLSDDDSSPSYFNVSRQHHHYHHHHFTLMCPASIIAIILLWCVPPAGQLLLVSSLAPAFSDNLQVAWDKY